MTPPTEIFKENPARGVFIRREIDHSLFKELFPRILTLRQSNAPICLYIESHGGQIFFADMISSLIRCPNQDGKSNHLITVGVGYVASCAADLLALGDYAIIYPFGHVHYHGTRQTASEVTLQNIPFLAGSLRNTNEQYAFRLAGKMFRRMTFLILEMMMAKSFSKFQAGQQPIVQALDIGKIDQEIQEFEAHLQKKLAGIDSETKLFDEASKKRTKFKDLVKSIRAFDKTGKGIDVNDQSTLFKHLLDLETKSNPGVNLTDLLPFVEDDFQQIRDFFFGKFQRDLNAIILESQGAFLTPSEMKQWQSQPTQQSKLSFIIKTAAPRLEPLWFLVVSLARTLQEGEFPLNPEEAYWLGLVDEIVGSNLPSLRSRTEDLREMERKMAAEQKAPLAQSSPT